MRTKDIISDWTSRKWHSVHRWKPGAGKFIFA